MFTIERECFLSLKCRTLLNAYERVYIGLHNSLRKARSNPYTWQHPISSLVTEWKRVGLHLRLLHVVLVPGGMYLNLQSLSSITLNMQLIFLMWFEAHIARNCSMTLSLPQKHEGAMSLTVVSLPVDWGTPGSLQLLWATLDLASSMPKKPAHHLRTIHICK